MKGMLIAIYNIIRSVFQKFGVEVEAYKDHYKIDENCTAVNVGAGNWECPGWINLDYPSEWYASAQNKHKYTAYDIRSDKLPFSDEKVDLIYCSHVIEHIEDVYILAFFKECFRVLNQGGVTNCLS